MICATDSDEAWVVTLDDALQHFAPSGAREENIEHPQPDDEPATIETTLRVLLLRDGTQWVALGLELDYAASGHDVDDVKDRFEKGLEATVNEHVSVHGSVEKLLNTAPQETWNLWLNTNAGDEFELESVQRLANGIREHLPLDAIAYLKQTGSA